MRPAQQAAPLRRRTRRDFLRQAGIAATAALLPGRSQALIQPPNVLMIVIDDLNDWVGFLRGHPDVQTPNLDRLAARSTVFRRAYCNAPVCSPSRASALSGLSVQQTKVFDNNTSPRVANPGIVFLPEHLARNGYEAKLIGKIYHTYSNPTPHPLPATLPATNLQCGAAGSVKPDGAFDWAPLDIDDSLMPDWQFAQSAISFLGQPRSKPFFLGLGLLRTHVAWYLPRKYFDLYPMGSFQLSRFRKGDLDDLPPAARAVARGLGENGCIAAQRLKASAIQAYLASISFVDAQIGRKAPLAQGSALGAQHTRAVRHLAAGPDLKRDSVAPRQPGGSDAHRARDLREYHPALCDGRTLARALAGRPLDTLGSPGADHPEPVRLCDPANTLALHPLRERRPGTL
jgi:hypothetical protein